MLGIHRELLAAMLVGLLLPALVVGGAAARESEPGRQIDAYLARVEEKRGLDAAVLVVLGDEVILRRGYGIADEAGQTPFTAETAVGIASISKQFTAAAIMRLVDQGHLSVNDTVGDLLAAVPPDKTNITLHQLLTHTSGLVSDHMDSDLEPLTKQTALDRIYASELLATPGAEYHYSNSGYTLLAAVVEAVSGQEHDVFLQNEFFDPLGMTSTGNWADPRFDSLPVSTGYFNGESSGPINELPGPYWTAVGNGGIVSTVDDLMTWYEALHSGQVLSAGSTEAVFTRHVAEDAAETSFYGYGWALADTELGPIVTHNGGGLTGNSVLIEYPEQELTIIILGNRITYQVIGPIPIVLGFPADETSEALAKNVAAGDFSRLPKTTFLIWPYLGGLVGVIMGVMALVYWIKKGKR